LFRYNGFPRDEAEFFEENCGRRGGNGADVARDRIVIRDEELRQRNGQKLKDGFLNNSLLDVGIKFANCDCQERHIRWQLYT